MEYNENLKPDDPIWYNDDPWIKGGRWKLGVFVRWTNDNEAAIISDVTFADKPLGDPWHYGHIFARNFEECSLTPPKGYHIFKIGSLTEAYKD